MKETVNHPPHYRTGNFECIDVMEEIFGKSEVQKFCIMNAFKYIYRCDSKHSSPLEDVRKAQWYLNKFMELENKNGKI